MATSASVHLSVEKKLENLRIALTEVHKQLLAERRQVSAGHVGMAHASLIHASEWLLSQWPDHD